MCPTSPSIPIQVNAQPRGRIVPLHLEQVVLQLLIQDLLLLQIGLGRGELGFRSEKRSLKFTVQDLVCNVVLSYSETHS